MDNLIEVVRSFRDQKRSCPNPNLEQLKKTYTELLQKEKTLEAFLDDNSIPIAMREVKIKEFKAITCQLNRLLIEISHTGYPLQCEEVRNGFV